MEIIQGLENFPKQRVPVVVALGTFDGLHLGHQALLALAVERARAVQGRCAVFTFDPHPRSVLGASPDGFLLTTLDERLELFRALGADLAVVVQFNDTFRRTSAEAWVTELVRRTMMAEVVCGANYVFGHDRRGNAALLRRLGGQHGFQVWTADPVGVDGAPVSSTRVRDALRAGRVTDAGRLLGRWYTLRGLVVRGDRGEVADPEPEARNPVIHSPQSPSLLPTAGCVSMVKKESIAGRSVPPAAPRLSDFYA